MNAVRGIVAAMSVASLVMGGGGGGGGGTVDYNPATAIDELHRRPTA